MYECDICYERRDCKDKIVLPCSHFLCKPCFEEVDKRSNTCPFCRADFITADPDPEEWLYLDPEEWIVYSKSADIYGSERIYIYRKEDVPGWRNDEQIIPMKRNRQRKKRIRNKNK